MTEVVEFNIQLLTYTKIMVTQGFDWAISIFAG